MIKVLEESKSKVVRGESDEENNPSICMTCPKVVCVKGKETKKNHSTQDSRVVPHRGTNWAALWLTAQIGRDAVLSESYGRGYRPWHCGAPSGPTWSLPLTSGPV